MAIETKYFKMHQSVHFSAQNQLSVTLRFTDLYKARMDLK